MIKSCEDNLNYAGRLVSDGRLGEGGAVYARMAACAIRQACPHRGMCGGRMARLKALLAVTGQIRADR